ncbi:hypothetical protein ACFE04_009615 [Oxalis oulophora]
MLLNSLSTSSVLPNSLPMSTVLQSLLVASLLVGGNVKSSGIYIATQTASFCPGPSSCSLQLTVCESPFSPAKEKMTEAKLLFGSKPTISLPSLRSLATTTTSPSSSLLYLYPTNHHVKTANRQRVLAMTVKRSPKRLKYAAPRFTKEDGLLYVEADPSGGDSWKLDSVIELLKQGAVGVIPTDTVYAIVCDPRSHSAVERLRRIKNIDSLKPLSMLCHSFRDIDTYTMGFPRGDGLGHANIFRAVKQCLPGPCVRSGTSTAKYATRKHVGVRMPDDAICQVILEKLDVPLISTSVKSPKENEWIIDPVVIADVYGPEGLDFVVDGGLRIADPSTVVDMTGAYPKVLRQGKGPKLPWMVDEENETAEYTSA